MDTSSGTWRRKAGRLADGGTGIRGRDPMTHLVKGSSYVMVIPVGLLLLAALGAFTYAGVLFVEYTKRIVEDPFPVERQIGAFLVLVDLLFVGTTLLIVALGLYELFVLDERRQDLIGRVPAWLVMGDLNDLKARAISMIVLVLAVSFADLVVDFGRGLDVVYVGSGIAVVVVALTGFLRFGPRASDERMERR